MSNSPAWSNPEMEKAFSSADFVLKTQQQIAKDFGNHGFQFAEDFEVLPYETALLKAAVQQVLSDIIEHHASKWLPLMYSLDISEKNYIRFFENAGQDWLSDFAFEVIRREAQKVFFRKKLK